MRMTPENVVEVYDDIAEAFHATRKERSIYPDPWVVFETVDELKLSKESWICDVGAGSGHASTPFKNAGYTNIIALEPSEQMRTFARQTGNFAEVKDFTLEKD